MSGDLRWAVDFEVVERSRGDKEMTRMALLTVVVLASLPLAVCPADSKPGPATAKNAQPKLGSTKEQREWLKIQMVKGLNNSRQVRQVRAALDGMKPQQIDVLANAALAQQFPANEHQMLQQTQWELQRARWLRQMLEREYWLRRNGYPVGYMPMITWLPQGTHFGANAVISGDRRYVRVSGMPFFSSVGPVYSYNLHNGHTRLMPQYGYPNYDYSRYNGYPSGSGGYRHGQMPPQHLPPKPKSPYAQTWHDGMRTRTGPRP